MPSVDFKSLKETKQAVKEGGIGKAFTGSQEYFLHVCEAMVELLANYSD